jgi:hypothetical protein
MSISEILAELPRLSPEDRAEVQAKLDDLGRAADAAPRPARIVTPRLADPRQAKNFPRQVTELSEDAAV